MNDVHFDLSPILRRMERLSRGIVAIDGPCTAGKSTLARQLHETLGVSVLPMDDFFLRPEQRTRERLLTPGGNIDAERFVSEALRPMQTGQDFAYAPFDCSQQRLVPPVLFRNTRISIVEGVYSQHPAFRDAYALKIFLTIDPDAQQARLLARNGEAMLRRFNEEWIPLENLYFQALDIAGHADIVLRA